VPASTTRRRRAARRRISSGGIKPEVFGTRLAVTVAAIDTGLALTPAPRSRRRSIAASSALAQSGGGPAPPVELRRGLLMASGQFLAPNDTDRYGSPTR